MLCNQKTIQNINEELVREGREKMREKGRKVHYPNEAIAWKWRGVRNPCWRRGARASLWAVVGVKKKKGGKVRQICTCPASPTRSYTPSEEQIVFSPIMERERCKFSREEGGCIYRRNEGEEKEKKRAIE